MCANDRTHHTVLLHNNINNNIHSSTKMMIVEAAKSSRSTCRKCSTTIEMGTTRIGEPVVFNGIRSYRYYHPHCCSPAQLQALYQSASSAQLSLSITGDDPQRGEGGPQLHQQQQRVTPPQQHAGKSPISSFIVEDAKSPRSICKKRSGVIETGNYNAQKSSGSCDGVYVLELKTPGFYYVGQSENVEKRLYEHMMEFSSSAFCKSKGGMKQAIPPLTPRNTDLTSWEQQETLARMMKHGFDKVRGYEFTSCDPLTRSEGETIKTLIIGNGNLCRHCGAPGHMVKQCNTKKIAPMPWLRALNKIIEPPSPLTSREVFADLALQGADDCDSSNNTAKQAKQATCERCGRSGHKVTSCYARKDIYKKPL